MIEDDDTLMLQGDELPIQIEETFRWSGKACIEECAGLCCKDRSYLMVSFHDILMILKSSYAKRIGIENTYELFEDEIPFLKIIKSPIFEIFTNWITASYGDRKPLILPFSTV